MFPAPLSWGGISIWTPWPVSSCSDSTTCPYRRPGGSARSHAARDRAVQRVYLRGMGASTIRESSCSPQGYPWCWILSCWSCPSWRNGWEAFLVIRFSFSEREKWKTGGGGGGGTINPRLGNQKKKEVRVSKQCKSSAKTSIAHKQQQQRARGRTNANTQNALTFLIPYRARTSPQKPSSSSHGGLRCRLTNHA